MSNSTLGFACLTRFRKFALLLSTGSIIVTPSLSSSLSHASSADVFENVEFSDTNSPELLQKLEEKVKAKQAAKKATPKTTAKTPKLKFMPDKKSQTIKFTLNGVHIEEASVIPEEELLQFTQDLVVGQPITLYQINLIAKRMNLYYQLKGYVLSEVVVLQKRPKNGIVRFQVKEGYIRKVKFVGDIKGSHEKLAGFARKLITGEAIKKEDLERYLLLIKALPGIQIGKYTAKSVKKKPGAYDLIIPLKHKTFTSSLLIDNRGTRVSGPLQFNFSHKLNSAFGQYEEWNTGFSTVADTKESINFRTKLATHIGSEGTKLEVSMDELSTSNLSGPAKAINVHREGTGFSGEVSHPCLLSQTESLTVMGKFSLKNSAVDKDPKGGTNTRDRLRVLQLGAEYKKHDNYQGKNTFGISLSRGLDVFKATTNPRSKVKSAPIGKGVFTKWEAFAQREQGLGSNLRLHTHMKMQYTQDPLLGAEKFGYGGAQFGKGFDGGALAGDRGIEGRIQLDWKNKFDFPFMRQTVSYVFYDGGHVQTIHPPRGSKRTLTAFSTGIGSQFLFSKNFIGMIEIAKPIRHQVYPTKKMQPRVFGGIVLTYSS